MMRRRRAFGLECQLEMTDDPVNRLRIIYKKDNSHPAATGRTDQWIHLVDLADHLGPALGRHIARIIFNNGAMRRISRSLTHLPLWALE